LAPTARRIRFARIAALRIVAVFFALIAVVCALALLAIPVAAIWPNGPVQIIRPLDPWMLLQVVLFGYGSARTSGHLWRRRRTGAFVALGLCAYGILVNYVGPLKGTQSVSIMLVLAVLVALGWPELNDAPR
jgi:hypothetical protein